jgi:type VI secretion system protein ImpM
MSDQPGLTVRLGLFGKHPAFGDFIGRGVPPALQSALEAWLGPTLAQVAAERGDTFADFFDHMPPLAFWIGAQVLAESEGWTVRGVVLPSCDRVGRRYPLALVQHPGPALPPTLVEDDGFLAAATRALEAVRRAEAVTSGDLLAGVPNLPMPADCTDPGDLFWATNPAASAASLWGSLVAADLRRASRKRSYWAAEARPGLSATALLACDGLPDFRALDWLMGGIPLPPSPDPDPAQPERAADDV